MSESHDFAAGGDATWNAFLAEPARWVEQSRLTACFGGALGTDLCARLAAGERFQARLSRRIVTHYGLSPVTGEAIDDTDRELALYPVDRLSAVVRRAGTIYWSGALANLVLARDVAILTDALGEDLYAFGLANRDLSGPVTVFPDLDSATTTITDDGWNCFNAWCAGLPAGVGQRIRLRFPPGSMLDAAVVPDLAEIGSAIVRRAVGGGAES